MLKKREYLKTVRRAYPPLWGSLIFSGASQEKYYKPFLNKPFRLSSVIKSEEIWYYPKKATENCSIWAFDYWMNPRNLEKSKKLFKKIEKELIKTTKSDFKTLSKVYKKYIPTLILIWRCDQPVENKIKELLTKKLPKKEAKKLLNELNIPLEDNFYKEEEVELIKAKDIERHIKKYNWLNSRYGEDVPYTVKEAKEKLSKINKEEYLKKYKEEKEKVINSIRKAKNILGKDSHIIDFLQFILHYRTHRTDILNMASYLFIPKLKEMAKEKGITYRQILHCTEQEIKNDIPSKEELNERIKNHALIGDEKGIYCVYGKESEKIKEFLAEDIRKVDEFKGQIASKGLIKGKVRLILHRGDFSKVQKGDILVTSMTTPEMVSAMEKASAFVTDEGGITCHAAIISREMKKPCIIGTKIATRILKDGDLIEVNANKGIVKKLNG